jgi:hypothetical protein
MALSARQGPGAIEGRKASWPGLTRPSTGSVLPGLFAIALRQSDSSLKRRRVGGRVKPGHDDDCPWYAGSASQITTEA